MIEEENPEDSEELYEHFSVEVDPGQALLRIDKFLMDRVPDISRSKLQQAAKAEALLVNEKSVKPNYKVKPGDLIQLFLLHEKRALELIPEDIPLEIVYEDNDLLVINKQAGLVVHPGHGNYTGTLVNGLIHHFDNLPDAGDSSRPGLVHRLDKLTSGLMVVAKTEYSMMALAKQFSDRTTDRSYYALVWGDVDDRGTIEGHIGRSLKNRKVMQVFEDGEFGKPAITHYETLERFGYVTLVKCKLETGRTHQIRVHFKHIGHHLFSDPEYGGDKILKGTTFSKYRQFVTNCFGVLNRQALHAKSLGFQHPTKEERMFFESDLPEDFEDVLGRWRNYVSSRKD